MKSLLAFCVAATLLMSCGGSDRIARFSPSLMDSLKATSLDLPSYEQKYGKHDGVFLVSEQTLEHASSEGFWGLYKMSTLKYVVLNPDAEWLTTFNIEVPGRNSLKDVRIQILAPDGTTQQFTKNDLKQEESTTSYIYKLAYPGIKKGSIVQESYEMVLPLVSYAGLHQDVRLQHSVPCEKLFFQYIIPRDWEIKLKEIAPKKIVPYTKTVNKTFDKVILSYQINDIPAIPNEPYSPFFKEIGNYVELMVTKYVGIEIPQKWTVLAGQFKEFAVDRGSFWSSKLESTVDDLTKNSPNDYHKLDTIVTFIQKNVKVGSNADDDNFADILKNGEANSFMITGLARAMLQEAGLQADYLLVHSARDGYFDQNYVSSDQLMIPVVRVVVAGIEYVVLPYIQNLPVDLVPDYLQGQAAMKVNEQGFGGFTTVPIGNATDNVVDNTYDLTIDDEGNITVAEERVLRGSNGYWARNALSELKDDELRKEIQDMLTYSDGDVKLTSHEIENMQDYKKPLVIKTRYTIDNLVTVTPDEVIFQTGGLFSPATSGKMKVDTEDRQNPIRIYYPEELNKKIRINHPASWKLETALNSVQRENQFGSIRANYKVENGALVVEHHRSLKRANEPKEKAGELLDVIGTKSRLNVPSLVFKVQEGSPATVAEPAGVTTQE